MEHEKNLKACLGDVDVTITLFDLITSGKIKKADLRRLASKLELLPIYNGYKDKDPFDHDVAIELLSDLLDKVSITTHYTL